MPLYANMDEGAKLAKARRLFREAESFWNKSYAEKSESADFFHGRQWTDEEKKYLEDQGRPALTFNVIATRIRSIVGMNVDNKQSTVVAPIGNEDSFKADVIGKALEAQMRMLKLDEIDDDVFERGLVEGDDNVHLDPVRDDHNPLWTKVNLNRVSGRELTWDIASRERDRSDAKYFFWHRWVDRKEFETEYPDKKADLEALFGTDDTGSEIEGLDQSASSTVLDGDDYEAPLGDQHRWLKKKAGKIRVIHMEYKVPVKKWFMVSPTEGIKSISERTGKAVESRVSQLSGVRVFNVWGEDTYWFEFIKTGVLFDAISPQPYDGFSIVPFSCFIDSETGFAYGPVRSMLDPQRDVNKGNSLSLEHLMMQPRPGYNAEVDAIENVKEFNRAVASGETGILKKGALTAGKIIERTVPQPSPAAIQRIENGLRMVGEVSGIVETAESPNRAQEQPVTFMLREKKSLRSHRGLLASFHAYQRNVANKLLQTMLRSFPDDQLEALIGNAERYAVRQGQVIDAQTGETVALRDIRKNRFDIELQPSAVSDNNRLNQLQLFTQLAVTEGVFVEPEFLLELAAETRSARERLIDHQKAASAQQSQQAQLIAQEQQAKIAQIEADTSVLIGSRADKNKVEQLKLANAAEVERMRLAFDRSKATTEQQLKLLEIINSGNQQQLDALLKIFDQVQRELPAAETTVN